MHARRRYRKKEQRMENTPKKEIHKREENGKNRQDMAV